MINPNARNVNIFAPARLDARMTAAPRVGSAALLSRSGPGLSCVLRLGTAALRGNHHVPLERRSPTRRILRVVKLRDTQKSTT